MAVLKFRQLTVEELKSNYTYDPNTGLFTRLKAGYRVEAGLVMGSKDPSRYLCLSVNNISYKAHRLAWLYVYGVIPSDLIDHKNGNRSDNRIANLRIVTNAENVRNQTKPQKGNTTGFLGVSIQKGSKKYRAMIKLNGKNKYLGLFDTAEQAHQVYLEAKRRLHKTCTI